MSDTEVTRFPLRWEWVDGHVLVHGVRVRDEADDSVLLRPVGDEAEECVMGEDDMAETTGETSAHFWPEDQMIEIRGRYRTDPAGVEVRLMRITRANDRSVSIEYNGRHRTLCLGDVFVIGLDLEISL